MAKSPRDFTGNSPGIGWAFLALFNLIRCFLESVRNLYHFSRHSNTPRFHHSKKQPSVPMKITDVTLQSYSWPKPKPIRNGKYTYTTVALNLIQVHTDEGLTGIGWGGGTAATRPGGVAGALVEHFKQALIGEDPFSYRRIWENMWLPKIVGRRGMSTHVISAIDIALWDLMGKDAWKVRA